MSLFDADKDPRKDLLTLAQATRDALATDDADRRFIDLRPLVSDGMAWRTVSHRRAGGRPRGAPLPPAAAAGISVGKPYAVRPAWEAALAILKGRPPAHEPGLLLVLEEEVEQLEARVRQGEQRLSRTLALTRLERRLASLEDALFAADSPLEVATLEAQMEATRWDIAEMNGHSGESGKKLPLALERAASRAAPMGAGDAFMGRCSFDRAILEAHQGAAPAFRGLRLAIDACAGASEVALAALGRFAQKHEALGWPLWLDEVATTLAGDPRRADSAKRLDAFVEGSPCERGRVVWMRASIERDLDAKRELWQGLSARHLDQPDEQRLEEFSIERETVDALLSPLHYLFLGFRTLYGAELATRALGALTN
jgi:hypothetical protein